MRKSQDKNGQQFFSILKIFAILIFIVGICFWALASLFPEAFHSKYSYLEAAQLIGVLVLVSSGLVFIKQLPFIKIVRNLTAWLFIATLTFLVYSYKNEVFNVYKRLTSELIPGKVWESENQQIFVTKSSDGHFYIFGEANGVILKFLIDTGATNIVLNPEDAKRIGIKMTSLRFIEKYNTAKGVGYGAPYRLNQLALGSFKIQNVKISVNQKNMATSLLGMSFLEYFKSFEIRETKLILKF